MCVTAILILAATAVIAQTAPPKDIDAYVDRVRSTFDVPGIGLAIVKDGKVVLAKGYGIRKMGEKAAVDEHTLFAIASNTKVFTATAIGILVEEGKLEWDAPVIRYLPWFRLSNPYVTNEITVRDLLVHRSGLGLGAGDLLWWPPSTYNRDEIARRLQYIPLVTSFRSAYAYDNVLYLVAGQLIESVGGMSWEDFIAKRIFIPVGMTESKDRHSDIGGTANAAWSHAKVEGSVRPVAPFTSDNTNPAGGVVTNAVDIAKWMITQLDSGKTPDGKWLFTPRTNRQLWTIVTPLGTGNPPPELSALRAQFNGYALGLGVNDFRGHKVISHTGGLPGFVSKVALLPDQRLGVAVFTNQESGAAFQAITMHIFDHYLKMNDTDWLAAYQKLMARSDSMMAAANAKTSASRKADSSPSLPLASYAGTYNDQWYGDIQVAQENGKLVITFTKTPSLVGDLEHWQYDTFVARWRDRELRADAFVTFSLRPDGTIREARMEAVSPETDFSFDFQDLLLKPVAKK